MTNKNAPLSALLVNTKLVSELRALFPDIYSVKRESTYTVPKKQISRELAELSVKTGIGEQGWDYEWDEHTNESSSFETDSFEFSGDKIRQFFDIADGNKAKVRKETLTFISQHLGNLKTGTDIVSLFSKWGVLDSLVEYPNTKWRMVFSVLCYYASSEEESDQEMFRRIIAEILHPLMYGGDKTAAQKACDEFNKYLEYDGLNVGGSLDDKNYYDVYQTLSREDEEQMARRSKEVMAKILKEEKDFLQRPESKEKISTLRQAYRVLMNTVEVFCENPSQPNPELNNGYTQTKTLVLEHHNYFRDGNFKTSRRLNKPHIPFDNLFAAERSYREKKKILHWDSIRPEMFAAYGEIEEVYNLANGSDILSKPEIQQTLNDTALLLSKIKEENRKNVPPKQTNIPKGETPPIVHKLEITKMPDINIKNADDNVVVKNKKRISLPKFPPTDWNKVEMKFIDNNTVYIKAGNKTTTADYESLGFRNDKNGKPDSAWKFLLGLSKNSGETQKIESPIPDKIKRQKKVLSDRLKNIFKNETDPFYDFSQNNTYKIKIKLTPEIEVKDDKYEVKEYLEETMTSEFEPEK